MKTLSTTVPAALATALVMVLPGFFPNWSSAMEVPVRVVTRASDSQYIAQASTPLPELTLHERGRVGEEAAQEPPRSDIPLPEDAAVVFSTAEFILYHTAASVDDVVEFYKQAMSEKGWEPYTVTMQIQDVGCQSYVKDDEAAYIMITPGDTGTGVMIRVAGITDESTGFTFDDGQGADKADEPAEKPQSDQSDETRLLYGIPLLPDASVDISSSEMIGYHSYVSVAEAGEFYEREMPERNWEPAPANEVDEDVNTLEYRKGKQSALVTIMPGDGATTYVLIVLGRAN